MKYRALGNTGKQVSALGFGAMRLPTLPDGTIDEDQATQMVRWAIDHGVNYIDTGYPYHGGQSESFLGRALQDGYREKVTLATKLLTRVAKEPADYERMLDEQLTKLQTDHIDVYLLHGLRSTRWPQAKEWGALDLGDRAKADGRIGAFGFSFHDSFALFKEIVDCHDWDVAQIQYNYMNEYYQAGTRGLRYAASKGLAVVVMEPLLGGKLAIPPQKVQAMWDTAENKRSAVAWALQWVWDQPEVSVVLSGMSTMQQVQENVASAERSGVAQLSNTEIDLVGQVRDVYRDLQPVPCTACGYCMPCPQGVNIPRTFTEFINGVTYNNMDDARKRYFRLLTDQKPEELASSCVQCGLCETKCPQDIVISEWMPFLHEFFEGDQAWDPSLAPA